MTADEMLTTLTDAANLRLAAAFAELEIETPVPRISRGMVRAVVEAAESAGLFAPVVVPVATAPDTPSPANVICVPAESATNGHYQPKRHHTPEARAKMREAAQRRRQQKEETAAPPEVAPGDGFRPASDTRAG